jgi:choline dehydrogenase-like flavoprotein
VAKSEIFDVCVIGTGAGGGVMLDRLTAAGFRVVALERGPHLATSQFDDDELANVIRDQLFSPEQIETYRLDAGSPAETGRFNQLAHCVGGTMTHWAAWSWRFREDEFRVLSTEGPVAGASLADWPISYADLEPFYEQAEIDFGVAGSAGANPFQPPRKKGYPNPPHPPRTSSAAFAAAAGKLGHRPFPVPVAINPRPYAGRPACFYGGACRGYGCMIHAKATTFSVSIPRALATGRLDLRPSARVFEIPVDGDGRVTGARYFDAQGKEQEVRARQVVLAANAIGSPQLLLQSTSGAFPHGLANSSGLVGANLTFHLHAGAAFLMEGPARAFTGFEAQMAVDDLHPSDPERGFIRGGVIAEVNTLNHQPLGWAFTAAGYPHLGRGWGAGLKRHLRGFSRSVLIGSVLEDLPIESNRVDLDPDVKDRLGLPVPRITHRQHPNDLAMHRWYTKKILEIAEASGASERWSLDTPGLGLLDEKTAIKGNAHFHGTCRMGADPMRSVVNRDCRAHDVPNLWIVDSSVLPTSGGYNPTLTILANAYRVADGFAKQARRLSL